MSVNKVELIGNLGRDVELRRTTAGVAVVDMRLATSETYTGKDGQEHQATEWHTVVCWGKTAENCAKYLSKGRQIRVEGSLRTRQYTDKTGQKRQVTEINARRVDFLGSAPKTTTPAPQEDSEAK
jgi:single-strand DNA-binding protein